MLLKEANSLLSRDELRCGLIRLKKERRADVEPRRVVDSPSVPSPKSRNSSSTLFKRQYTNRTEMSKTVVNDKC